MGTKNCPETARQKMINMMYLVLTAMLALNVAAETLTAFKVVDKSLINTYTSFTNKNKSILSNFKSQYELNQNKVEAWMIKAQRVNELSDTLINYILDTKKLLALESKAEYLVPGEEIPDEFPLIQVRGPENEDTLIIKKQDDLNASPIVMLTKGRGKELQEKVIQFRDELTAICNGNEHLERTLKASFDVEDPERRVLDINQKQPNYKTWVEENFQTTPIVAAITLLSKLQIDVRNAESAVLSYLYNQIDAASFKFTGLEAKIIPTSNYIFQGQSYQAKVFLSAIDTTSTLQAYLSGSDSPLPVKGNEAIVNIPATQTGFFTRKGEIRFKDPDGNEGKKYFEFEYQVAAPTLTVSPTKMNVLYKNIKNPVSISVPGVSNDKLEVSITNGVIRKIPDGEWEVEPNELDETGNKTKVQVFVIEDGKKHPMGEFKFRVKRVPDPKATVAKLNTGTIDRNVLKAQRGVFAQLEDFMFDMNFEITSFDFSVATSGGMTTTLHSSSYAFSNEMLQMINSLGAGSKLSIENIKARKEGDTKDPERILSPIVLTVK